MSESELAALKARVATLEREVRRLRVLAATGADEDPAGEPFDDDEPDIDPCPDCGRVYCACDDPDHHCRSCGRLSGCIDNGLCGMCFELQGGVLLPGQ